MSVSQVLTKDGKKNIYVMFTRDDCVAEGMVPDCRIISNKGFDDSEVEALEEYMDKQQGIIVSMAKTVNVMKAFLGKK